MRLDIVCLSHLAFEQGLFQRPQHLASQFVAMGHRVRYLGLVGQGRVSELTKSGSLRGTIAPAGGGETSGWGIYEHLPFHPSVARLRSLRQWWCARTVRQILSRTQAPPGHHDGRFVPVTMIYHPELLELAEAAGVIGGAGRPGGEVPDPVVVYDIMDRFTAFGKSGEGTGTAEQHLIGKVADLVVAGGWSLHGAAEVIARDAGRTGLAPVRFPSAVDRAHFGRALDDATPVDPVLKSLQGPIAGYFGAVDERMDWPLLVRLAREFVGGHVVLVGPVLVPPPGDLPANLHLVGPRPYGDLPGVLKAFSVALIPFVRSALTDHISPTKAPEYLAGGCPVVSVAIPDVVRDWPGKITVAESQEDFVSAVIRQVAHPADRTEVARWAEVWPTWTQIARDMERMILDRWERNQ